MAKLGVAAIVFVVLWVAVLILGHEGPDGSATGARGICEKFIQAQLRDPNSVEWVSRHNWPTKTTMAGRWEVLVQYRARNGFGGMNSERAMCTVFHQGGGNWRLIELTTL